MGRRSVHTPEELRQLILQAATELIASAGFSALSAREIARRIGYSAGTIYNVFDNLDDLVLTIEARMLDELAKSLDSVPATGEARERVMQFAEAYLQFTHDNPRLWNLLFEHHLPEGIEVPISYREKLDGLLARVETALAPLVPENDQDGLQRRARVLWAGVHGITSLSTADKLSSVTSEAALPMVRDLVSTYLDGLAGQR
ncbi:MAG: TetR/AcrR family transcriptional regulator [Hyphomicrobiaceae bacterium]|nr:TetR/AcrR family transcriptional regulator [Hyphomicrobiaceae bacterium]